MQDYKCGEMLATEPHILTMMQLLAVPVGALSVSLIYPALVKTYGAVGGAGLPVRRSRRSGPGSRSCSRRASTRSRRRRSTR